MKKTTKKPTKKSLPTEPRDQNGPGWIVPPPPDAGSAVFALPLPDGWRDALPQLFVDCDEVFASEGSPGMASQLVAVVAKIGQPIEGMAPWLFDFGVRVHRLGEFVDVLVEDAVARTIQEGGDHDGSPED